MRLVYEVIRSRRRTMAIQITSDAKVQVRAPLFVPDEVIEAFVHAKQGWILSHLEQQEARRKEKEQYQVAVGSRVLLLGNWVPIIERPGCEAELGRHGFFVPEGLSSEQLKKVLIQLYRGAAQTILEKKTAYQAEIMGVKPAGVRITGAKTRWGSCSAQGRICYSWKLVMAPEKAVDYVVVHELAHLKELNHSQRFWRIVKQYMSDWKSCRAMLRELSITLSQQNWD